MTNSEEILKAIVQLKVCKTEDLGRLTNITHSQISKYTNKLKIKGLITAEHQQYKKISKRLTPDLTFKENETTVSGYIFSPTKEGIEVVAHEIA